MNSFEKFKYEYVREYECGGRREEIVKPILSDEELRRAWEDEKRLTIPGEKREGVRGGLRSLIYLFISAVFFSIH